MDLTTLFNIIQRTLAEEGFHLCSQLRNDMSESHFVLSDSDVYQKQVDPRWNYNAYYGNWLEVRRVSHRNQAKMDTSYYLDMTECINSSSHTIPGKKKLKLKCEWIEPTQVKKIKKYVAEYKQYLNELELLKKIEEYINKEDQKSENN